LRGATAGTVNVCEFTMVSLTVCVPVLVAIAVRPEEVLVDWLVTVVQEVIVVRLWLPTVEVSNSKTADKIKTVEKNDLATIRKITTSPHTVLTIQRICHNI
jgi:hypothetical protein